MHDSNSAKSKLSFQGRKNKKKTINCRHNDISRKNTITNRIKISKRMHESYIHNTHTTTKLDARLKKNKNRQTISEWVLMEMILWSNFSSISDL